MNWFFGSSLKCYITYIKDFIFNTCILIYLNILTAIFTNLVNAFDLYIQIRE